MSDAKMTAHFHLYSSDGKDLGSWEDVPIAVIPPVGADVILNVGNDVWGLDLEDFAVFDGTVREISLYTFNRDGRLLVNIDVIGEVL